MIACLRFTNSANDALIYAVVVGCLAAGAALWDLKRQGGWQERWGVAWHVAIGEGLVIAVAGWVTVRSIQDGDFLCDATTYRGRSGPLARAIAPAVFGALLITWPWVLWQAVVRVRRGDDHAPGGTHGLR